MLPSFHKRLLEQAGEDKHNLGRLLSGAMLFFLGMGMIYISEHYASQTLQGEITALAGLVFAAAGGILAAWGYLGLSVMRLLKFLKNDK